MVCIMHDILLWHFMLVMIVWLKKFSLFVVWNYVVWLFPIVQYEDLLWLLLFKVLDFKHVLFGLIPLNFVSLLLINLSNLPNLVLSLLPLLVTIIKFRWRHRHIVSVRDERVFKAILCSKELLSLLNFWGHLRREEMEVCFAIVVLTFNFVEWPHVLEVSGWT